MFSQEEGRQQNNYTDYTDNKSTGIIDSSCATKFLFLTTTSISISYEKQQQTLKPTGPVVLRGADNGRFL
jgi:hypothetical protein